MAGKTYFKTLSIKDKVVLITGASAGIGKAIAIGFAEQGCKLILAARRQERLEELKSQLQEEFKVDVLIISLDVQDLEKIKKLPEELPADFKNIDILINNAGLGVGTELVDTFNIDEMAITYDTNVKSVLALMRVFIPGMKERGYGHVINMSSIVAEFFNTGGATYFASKHAVKAISECSRQDLVKTPIRITEIRPGWVTTEFFDVWQGKEQGQKFLASLDAVLDPLDVADNCVYAATRFVKERVIVMRAKCLGIVCRSELVGCRMLKKFSKDKIIKQVLISLSGVI